MHLHIKYFQVPSTGIYRIMNRPDMVNSVLCLHNGILQTITLLVAAALYAVIVTEYKENYFEIKMLCSLRIP